LDEENERKRVYLGLYGWKVCKKKLVLLTSGRGMTGETVGLLNREGSNGVSIDIWFRGFYHQNKTHLF